MTASQLTTRAFSPAPGIAANIRVLDIDGSPWFVASDVCRAVGLPMNKGTFMHLSKLDPDEKRTITAGQVLPASDLGTPHGGLNAHTKLAIISESGLYRMMMRGDKPEALAFQNWVTRDVLPAIRKTGVYVAGEEKLKAADLSLGDLNAINGHLQAILEHKAEILKARVAALSTATSRKSVPSWIG